MSSITCRGITKSFGSSPVLEDLDLEVPDGTVVTVLGESGSGKTTLLRVMAGFERPDAGTVTIDDEEVDGPHRYVPPEGRRIGYVAQEGNLFPHLTVAKNVGFGLPRSARGSNRVDELLGLVGLGDLGRRYPHELSGGQQQRVALARALAPHPRLVLLDEPFSSLDAGLRSSLRVDVIRILRERRTTAVLVTHDQSEALSVADLVGIMEGGRIRQFAAPETLYTRPVDPTVARFLGEANILSGDVVDGRVATRRGNLPLAEVPDPGIGRVLVLIHPEQVALELGATDDRGAVTGEVVHREYYGHDSVMMVGVAGLDHPLRVRCPGRSAVTVGDRVAIRVTGDVVAWRTELELGNPPAAAGRAPSSVEASR